MLRVTGMVTSSRSIKGPSGGVIGKPEKKSAKSAKSAKKTKSGKSSENIGVKVGKFDGGMLKLSSKDLAKIKSKK